MSFKGSIKIDRIHFVVWLFLLRSHDKTKSRISVVDTSHTLYFQQNIANVQPRPSLKKSERDSLSLIVLREGEGGRGGAQANKDKE